MRLNKNTKKVKSRIDNLSTSNFKIQKIKMVHFAGIDECEEVEVNIKLPKMLVDSIEKFSEIENVSKEKFIFRALLISISKRLEEEADELMQEFASDPMVLEDNKEIYDLFEDTISDVEKELEEYGSDTKKRM